MGIQKESMIVIGPFDLGNYIHQVMHRCFQTGKEVVLNVFPRKVHQQTRYIIGQVFIVEVGIQESASH